MYNRTGGTDAHGRRGPAPVTGRPPQTPADFITADALDPHTYSDKTQGAESEVVVVPIESQPGQGVVGTRLYIPSEEVQNLSMDPSRILSGQGAPMILGDDRGTDPLASAEDSRVSIYVDYENGVVIARQNPTVTADDSDRPRAAIPDGVPTELVVHDATMSPTGPMFGLPKGANTHIGN
ncbi:hypothetical protein NCCP2495_24620 [Dietzia sp. NCCP-2495]|uniref:hypothetical protein n=1 Tax=Dietzia sp. NCCP-2495 TaxID=2934675 RepID=UPI00222FBFE5|nr:hypothetical protein [Dietzia sp. NCCP-2495]GLB64583.1 hypothetical protein NCCP2495_24620 [Dietzia sp. NCCP-2495]